MRLLPTVNKRDPTALPPELREDDARRGVLDLLTRGFLPADVDLTPAFSTANSDRGILKNARTRLYERHEVPAKPTPFSQPSGFNVASLKFDLAPSPSSSKPVPESSTATASTTLPRLQSPLEEEQRQHLASRVVLAFQGTSADSKKRRKSSVRGATNQQEEAHEDEGEAPDGVSDESSLLLSMDDITGASGNAMEELGANVDKIRGYSSLLDRLSLHQFAISRGRAARSSPEFTAFQRSASCADVWGAVEQVVHALEALLSLYFVPLAHIDGTQVLNLARTGQSSFSRSELLHCVLNCDQVAALIARPGQRYKGKDRRKRAAQTLQSALRMFARRRAFRRQRLRVQSAEFIQRHWRVWLARSQLVRDLEVWRLERDARWDARMRTLRTQWGQITGGTGPRVIVHVPSLSGLTARARLSIANLGARQNLQLARIAALANMGTNVEIVYVSPFELPTDVAGYALRLLELAGVHDVRRRVRFMAPEQAGRLPAHFSLASLLLYSPKCLSRIRRATRGKAAYLVAGHPGDEDRRLAQALDLPLLGWTESDGRSPSNASESPSQPPPSLHLPLTTRSGAKRAFLHADVNVPFGAVDLFDEHEVALALAKLLVAHLDFVGTWKLQLDVDPLGVGLARIDTSQLSSLRDLRRESSVRTPDYWRQPGTRDAAVRQVLAEIERKTLARVAIPVIAEAFPSWTEFSRAMGETGVVVEAEPPNVVGHIRANLFIEPQGDVVHVTSTHDVLHGRLPFNKAAGLSAGGVPIGYAFPQSAAPPEAVEGAATAVARCLAKEHGAWGYVSMDFVLFRDERVGGAARLWATALHPFLTDAAASFAVFRLLTHASAISGGPSIGSSSSANSINRSESTRSVMTLSPHMTAGDLLLAEAKAVASSVPTESTPPSRCYVVSDYIFHPGVATMPYSGFFHACRLHGVCLDVERALGSVFLLTDSLAAGVFGILSVSETRTGSFAFLRTALEAIAREVGTGSCVVGGDPSDDGDSSGNFSVVLAAIRVLAGGDATKLDKKQRRGRER
jgi:hypothetical protein